MLWRNLNIGNFVIDIYLLTINLLVCIPQVTPMVSGHTYMYETRPTSLLSCCCRSRDSQQSLMLRSCQVCVIKPEKLQCCIWHSNLYWAFEILMRSSYVFIQSCLWISISCMGTVYLPSFWWCFCGVYLSLVSNILFIICHIFTSCIVLS